MFKNGNNYPTGAIYIYIYMYNILKNENKNENTAGNNCKKRIRWIL